MKSFSHNYPIIILVIFFTTIKIGAKETNVEYFLQSRFFLQSPSIARFFINTSHLRFNQNLNKLLVGVLVQADQNVQGGGAVRDEVAVDLMRQDQIQEKFEKTSHLFIDWGVTHLVSDHVASKHLQM